MATNNQFKRNANILRNAVNNGFVYDELTAFWEVMEQAETFILENTEPIEAEAEYSGSGSSQHINYQDGDFSYESWGEIFNWPSIVEPGDKVRVANIVDSQGRHIELYVVA
jgi:hypothetical protein